MRRAPFAWLAVITVVSAAAAANIDPDLYSATVFVSGQGQPERARGTELAFEEVLVKVSGDPHLARDPHVAALAKEAGALVASYDYRDRKQGLPLIDEQGTRDRPFDLTVHFDPAQVDTALHALDHSPWTGSRPRLAVFLAIQDQQTRYVLAQDSVRGLGQRQALAAVAGKRALPVVLPSKAMLDTEHITYEALAATAPGIAEAAKRTGGDAALSGTLVWSDAALGWTAAWRIATQGKDYRWGVSGVSFDDAFRNAVDGALGILSGHGNPD